MGICVSSASMEKEEGGDNVVCMVEEEGWWSPNAARRLASLYSRQGKKGPNQDSAIFCLGYGMEEGVFCGVFDGHGRNGHMVSKLVRDLLPSLVLSQREALLLADGDYDAEGAGDAESSVDFDDCSVSSSPEMFDEWKEACISAFRAMDRELTQHPDLDCCYSGTTAVTVIKQGKDLIIANLGDSRAVLGTLSEGGDPMAVPLTTDLKPSLPLRRPHIYVRVACRRSGADSEEQRADLRAEGRTQHSTRVAPQRRLPGARHGQGLRRLPAQEVRRHRRPPGLLPPPHLQRPVPRPRH
uniref:protein-serine/threonine phosphatase n=1 Tax=Anthurium amnicola TaxID=1678845 RepID=A0A1D1Y2P5_9ARAE